MSIEFSSLSEGRKRYWGGFLDQNLNLSIQISKIKSDPSLPEPDTFYYTPSLTFVRNDRSIVDYFNTTFPGEIYPRKTRGVLTGWQ